MNRKETLKQAEIETKNRPHYGPVEDNFADTAAMWSIILGVEVTPQQVGNMMIAAKLCREKYGHKDDNLVDIAGYAAITNEISGS